MKKVIITLILVLSAVVFTNAQSSINDYKYVVVPHFYEFLKGKDVYRLNTITRFLLKKKGFNAFMKEEINESDYSNNKCLALTTDVVSFNSMLKTKLKVVLKNCDGDIIFESKLGDSKSKTYEVAYKEALNKAFDSFGDINYHYTPNENIISRANKDEHTAKEEAAKEVEKLKAEIEELKEKQIKVETNETLKKEAPSRYASDDVKIEKSKSYLKAKPITNGFELINSISNKVEFIVHSATIPNVFMIKNKKGIIYKKDNQWVREYVEGEKTIVEELDIRF